MGTPAAGHHDTASLLAADRERFDAWMHQRFGHVPRWRWAVPAWLCVRLHRHAHAAWTGGGRWRGRLLMQLNALLTGADLHPQCRFGPGLVLRHPPALTASGCAGANFTMSPLSGIGMLPRPDDVGAGPGLPLLGDGVWLGPACGVLGPVRVGDGARVGPGSALTRDVAAGAWVVPAGHPRPAQAAAMTAPADAQETGGASPCTGHRWADTRRLLRADVDRYLAERLPGVAPQQHSRRRRLGVLLTHEVVAVALHRLAHHAHAAGHRRMAAALAAANQGLLRACLHPASCIGGGWFLPHPAGAIVQGHAGSGLTMYARSALLAPGAAEARPPESRHWPRLGDDVVVAGMAAVVGPAWVGAGVRVGFNMHLQGRAAAGSSVAGPMMRTATLETPLATGTAPAAAADRPDPGPAPGTVRALWRADRAVQRLLGASWSSRLAVALFRASQAAWQAGRPRAARRLWQLNVLLSGADLDPRSRVGGGFVLPCPVGVSLHVDAGSGLHVGPLVVAGPAHLADPDGLGPPPRLGDGVVLSLHSKVCGPHRLGSGVRVGMGCCVEGDLADGASIELHAPRLHGQARGVLAAQATA